MARRAAARGGVSESTDIVPWDEELARDAQAVAEMEKNTGGAPGFKVRAGQLTYDGAVIPGNKVTAIVVAYEMLNAFYTEGWSEDAVSPPLCFAIGEDEKTMAPHESVVERDQHQHEQCHGCPMNQFNTANTGRGKACNNRRRLVLLSAGNTDKAGNFDPYNADELSRAEFGLFSIPPTSLKNWAAFAKGVSASEKRPPYAVYCDVSVIPDTKSQFQVVFEFRGKVPNALQAVVQKKRAEGILMAQQPLSLDATEEEPSRGRPAAAGGRGKPAAAGRGKPAASTRPPVRGAKATPAKKAAPAARRGKY